MRKYRNIKGNLQPKRILKYSEEWIEYRKKRGADSVKVEHCDVDTDGFHDAIVRDWRSPALKKQQTCIVPPPKGGPLDLSAEIAVPEGGPLDLSAAIAKPSTGPVNVTTRHDVSTVSEHGTVFGSGVYIVGEPVALQVFANTGFAFSEWTPSASSLTIADNQFTMPAQNITVTAEYVAESKRISLVGDPPSGVLPSIWSVFRGHYEPDLGSIGKHYHNSGSENAGTLYPGVTETADYELNTYGKYIKVLNEDCSPWTGPEVTIKREYQFGSLLPPPNRWTGVLYWRFNGDGKVLEFRNNTVWSGRGSPPPGGSDNFVNLEDIQDWRSAIELPNTWHQRLLPYGLIEPDGQGGLRYVAELYTNQPVC